MPSAPVAIVTAAGKGIGAACGRLLAQQGYHLALFARGSELGNLATELDALAVTGDLADSATIERLVHETQQRYGRVDAVVNNTAHAAKGDLLTLTDEDWHRTRSSLAECHPPGSPGHSNYACSEEIRRLREYLQLRGSRAEPQLSGFSDHSRWSRRVHKALCPALGVARAADEQRVAGADRHLSGLNGGRPPDPAGAPRHRG